jgi:hypothetical protein
MRAPLMQGALAVVVLVLGCGAPTGAGHHPVDESGGAGGDEPGGGSGGTGGGGSGGSAGHDAGPMGGIGGGDQGGSSGDGGAGGTGSPDAGGKPDAAKPGDTPPPPPPIEGVFKHPGVLVNKAQLDFIRDKVAAGAEPWKSAFEKTKARASLTATPMPLGQIICGPYSMPNIGCAEEMTDAIAAWSDTMVWVVTGDEAYAKKAVEVMNAWAATIKGHSDSNAPLQAGWAASLWPRAGEVLRSTYAGWAPADVEKFKGMLKNVYLPAIVNGNNGANGNWDLTMIEGTIGIAVFLDDKATFDKAVARWRKRVPAYVYLKSDGAQPVQPPGGGKSIVSYWAGQSTFVDGLSQETCRDLLHTQLGMSAAINAAETARQQGVDLYGMESERLRAGLEFHADYMLGKTPPAWLCGGKLNMRILPMWEIAFNHYKNRLGLALPLTEKLITSQIRPMTSGIYKQMAWETLTHAETGKLGLE